MQILLDCFYHTLLFGSILFLFKKLKKEKTIDISKISYVEDKITYHEMMKNKFLNIKKNM